MNGAVVHVCHMIIKGLCRGFKIFRITRQGNIDILTSFVKVKVKEAQHQYSRLDLCILLQTS